jgi:hypothetical protein
MPTKRNIKNEVEDLKYDDGSTGSPLVLKLTGLMNEPGEPPADRDDSPHPELTVQPWPDQRPKSFSVAVPKVLPEPWRSESMLFVHNCEDGEKYRLDHMDDDNSVVTACQLWDALSEEQLREDKAIRKEQGEQIPPRLKDL